jgi:ABC-2 type transport system ATP-binding protein
MIGARELLLMKPTAILVNTSRGPVVDEPALAEALEQRLIANGAGAVGDQPRAGRGSPVARRSSPKSANSSVWIAYSRLLDDSMVNGCLAELRSVTKRFGKTMALDRLDLRVMPGELLALLGPNGAGKTTAISILLGLQRPDSGMARLCDRRQVGVMMQEVGLAPEVRVREHIDLVASYYPAPLPAAAVMELTHTVAIANRPYAKLSGGQKRQTQFAMAICGRPKLLFLDEPTVGLDVQARKLLWDTLADLLRTGTAIVLTTHYLEEAEALADRVVVLANGRSIASGTVGEIRAVVGRKRISCASALSAGEVGSWPGVDSVDRDRRQLHITASNAEEVVRRLLAADEHLEELEVRRAGLAEAFMELTQEAS